MTLIRRAVAPFLVVGGLLVAPACGGDADDGNAAPELGPVLDNPGVGSVQLPLDGYELDPDDYATFQNARDILVRTCMEAQGFEHPTVPHDAISDPAERRFGIVNLERARVSGFYGPLEARDERSDGGPALTDDRRMALVGSLEPGAQGGCIGEALEQLGAAELAAGQDLAQQLVFDASNLALADDRLLAVMNEWSGCMSEKGYAYEDPWAAWDDPRWLELRDHSGGAASDEEIAAAVADVECKRAHNVLGMWLAVETAYQDRAIEEHSEELEEIAVGLDAVRRASATVMATPAG